MKRQLAISVVLCLSLSAATAGALPPEKVLFMAPNDARYVRTAKGSWVVESSDEKVARASYFKPGEVLIETGTKGTALVTLSNDVIGQFLVWQVVVADKSRAERPDPTVLAGPCGCGRGGDYPLRCTVKSSACLDALRGFFEKGGLSTADVRVIYEIQAAQSLLKQMQAAVEKAGFEGVQLAMVGANLRVKAAVADEKLRRKLLLLIYYQMVGKLVLDDQITVAKSAPTAH